MRGTWSELNASQRGPEALSALAHDQTFLLGIRPERRDTSITLTPWMIGRLPLAVVNCDSRRLSAMMDMAPYEMRLLAGGMS